MIKSPESHRSNAQVRIESIMNSASSIEDEQASVAGASERETDNISFF